MSVVLITPAPPPASSPSHDRCCDHREDSGMGLRDTAPRASIRSSEDRALRVAGQPGSRPRRSSPAEGLRVHFCGPPLSNVLTCRGRTSRGGASVAQRVRDRSGFERALDCFERPTPGLAASGGTRVRVDRVARRGVDGATPGVDAGLPGMCAGPTPAPHARRWTRCTRSHYWSAKTSPRWMDSDVRALFCGLRRWVVGRRNSSR